MTKLQKLIGMITLLLPLSVYLFIVAAVNNVEVDYHIKYKDKTYQTFILDDGSGVFLKDDFGNIEWVEGKLTYRSSLGAYGILIKEGDIIRINKDYHTLKLVDERLQIVPVKKSDEMVKKSPKLGTAFIVSMIGIGIIALVVSGKMQWQKKYPIIATLIALTVGTLVLLFINTVVGSLLNVFMIFTLSWGAFTIEYYAFKNKKDNNVKTDKRQAEIERLQAEVDALKELANG